MMQTAKKFKKGTLIQFGKSKAIVTSDLMEFKGYYAIYADITENVESNMVCGAYKLHDKIALILRDKVQLEEIGLTPQERTAIYCHELGHCFSVNQGHIGLGERNIADEVDSDTFAVKQCGIKPELLESALAKSYEYEIKNMGKKKNLTQERLDRYLEEMKARKQNVRRLINELHNGDIIV